MPNRLENFRKIDNSKDRLRSRLGFVKPIPYGQRKIKNFKENGPYRGKISLARKENGVRLYKKK